MAVDVESMVLVPEEWQDIIALHSALAAQAVPTAASPIPAVKPHVSFSQREFAVGSDP